MMSEELGGYDGVERRREARVDYVVPLFYKVCKEETISKLLEGYTSNVSSQGLLCSIKDRVNQDSVLWLMFDRDTLDFCAQIEKSSIVYQKGIVGKVVRVQDAQDGTYEVGIRFITREEKGGTSWKP
ncbi:MAG: PilZ domain-containing protein [Candidatus Omnitrophica bacterium]|nr:PilZ domain-containing protein [Candidatus Omnitrophota bacterium]